MKNIDKFLLGIVAAAVILVLVVFAVALKRQSAYQPEDQPEGVAYNYLLALLQKDYERAYGYLLPTLRGYPSDVSQFKNNVDEHSHTTFDITRQGASRSLEVISVLTTASMSTVEFRETRYYDRGLFDSGESSTSFSMRLQTDKYGGWKIWDADIYWLNCWGEYNGCK
jgi:hypothetical protein